ncbi:hypothetical protein ONS95_001198 [Cadophora gregata]|uniref:uncharacterized protein n=1 Tax=Cadophora gregata TaxID=51156 RepID=UPI0026DADDCD|nr:uncharacterized protein ONS95_001198 [Cadophora gregata]KAK0101996.1 hypothetical protein ONS96_005964 [Cadophora gregata f. sp. sojae]KAK0129263.1 hypothetical protein ONS95_001198 [Cadophora gregata]
MITATMANAARTVINPAEDPRLNGDEIPTYLFKACQRWSDKSPSSPSLKGFRAASSGIEPHEENRDSFPASKLHLEAFYDKYCGIMDNQDTFQTTTHVQFVGLYSKRTLAEWEAELLRKGSDTEYRVYCVRGASLRDMGVSIIRGRATVSIGRGLHTEVVHTNSMVGEEFLVWGRVPVEAILGSWGADGVMQFARARQDAERKRDKQGFVPYIDKFQPGSEVSGEEALAFADSSIQQTQARRLASSSKTSEKRPQLSLPFPPLMTSIHPPTALGRPTHRKTRVLAPPPPINPRQAPHTKMVASAGPLHNPSYQLPSAVKVLTHASQQQQYQSPYEGARESARFNQEALQQMTLCTSTGARSVNISSQSRITQSPPLQKELRGPQYGTTGQMGGTVNVDQTKVEKRQDIEAKSYWRTEDDDRAGD